MTRDGEPVDPPPPPDATTPDTRSMGRTSGTIAAPIHGYLIGDVIGRGGMGEVVLAHDLRLGRDVALKRMRAAEPSQELIDRFLREVRVQALLDHPAIAPVHELGYDDEGRPYFTMKRVAGTIMQTLLHDQSVTLQRLLRGLVDVCLAVELAHSRGIVHRDLKPSNIMFGDYGEVYVLDWGVARVLVRRAATESVIGEIGSLDGETRAGTLLGTPGYMAPEQVRAEDVGPRADVYALGAILFEVLAGEPLHPRGDAALATTLHPDELSPAKRRPDRRIPPELDITCMSALSAEPTERPSARALADAIQGYLDGDRDLEARRTAAGEALASSSRALAAGDRATAIHDAGRALVLDPTSTEASAIALSMIVEQPAEIPPELDAELAREEQRLMRERSRRAIAPYLSLFLMTPVLPFLHVTAWWMPIMLGAVFLATTIVSLLNYKVGVPAGVMLLAQTSAVLAFSRVMGPFVLTPLLLAAVLMSATSLPWMNTRPWAVVAWTTVAAMAPFLLEAIGVMAPSWQLGSAGLVSTGTLFHVGVSPDPTVIICGSLAASIIVALYARRIGRDRSEAQRKVFIQAWQLRHLLPRGASAAVISKAQ